MPATRGFLMSQCAPEPGLPPTGTVSLMGLGGGAQGGGARMREPDTGRARADKERCR
jgi:hypothetical protein